MCIAGPVLLSRGLSIGRGVSAKEMKLKPHWIQFSGNHCALTSEETPDGLQWFITDSSTNGTWLNTSDGSTKLDKGVKVRVAHNDKIQLSVPPAEILEFQFILDPPPQPATLKRKAPMSNEYEQAMSRGGSSPGNGIEKEMKDEARAHKKVSPAQPHPSVPQYKPEGGHPMPVPSPAPAPAISPLPLPSLQQAGVISPIAGDSSSALISAHYEKQLSELHSRLEKTRAMADDSQKELIKERERVVRMEREHEAALRSVEQKAEGRSMALVDAANKELEATRIRLDESSARLTDLESRLSEEKSKGAQADSSLAQLKGEIEAHKASLLKAHATIEALNEEIQAHGVKVSCMERDRESLEGRLREEEGVRVRAQEDLLAASRAIEAQVEAKGAAQKALEGLRAQLHDQEARRDQEHWSRVAAEAKTLTLESELYEARRTIELLEERVQGVTGRGDLLKIRAEDLARATTEAYSRVCSLSTLMLQIHQSTHEMTTTLNPNSKPDVNPSGVHEGQEEMMVEEGEQHEGAAHGGGDGGGLFETPPPSSHPALNPTDAATALACNGVLQGSTGDDQEEEEEEQQQQQGGDVVMEEREDPLANDGGVPQGGQGEPEVITITTQMEEALDEMVAVGAEGGVGEVRVKEEVVEVEVEEEDEGQRGDLQGGGGGGAEGGEGEGEDGGGGQESMSHVAPLPSPVHAFDLTTQIVQMSYPGGGGAFGSSIMVATATGQDPPPPPLVTSALPPSIMQQEAQAQGEGDAALAPVTDTLVDKEGQGMEEGPEAAAPPPEVMSAPPPEAAPVTSLLLQEVAPYCEYDSSLVAAGTSSERDPPYDLPPPPAPPPSAAEEGMEEGPEAAAPPPSAAEEVAVEEEAPAHLPAMCHVSKMVVASEGEGGRTASERIVLADIANAAL